MSGTRYAEGECYLIVQCCETRAGINPYVLRIDRATQRKPALAADEVALKVRVQLPVALFLKPTLSASIKVEGETPTLELDTETVSSIEDLIRSAVGLDVELNVISPDDE